MYGYILDKLPYKSTFLFVDDIRFLTEKKVVGEYFLKKDAFFYEDHFPGFPVTPGVILTEVMVQIGLVVLGIYQLVEEGRRTKFPESSVLFPPPSGSLMVPLLTSTEVNFFRNVLPGEKVTVTGTKQYFRLGKLKSYVEMINTENELVALGTVSGVIQTINVSSKAGVCLEG